MSSLTYMRTSSLVRMEGTEYTVYGISCSNGQDCINDISTRPELVDKILEDLNRGEISPIHFRDILDDLIAKYE